MPVYFVQSVATRFVAVTDGAARDAVVATKNGAIELPPNAALTFSAPLEHGPAVVTIAGPDGLYITLPDDAGEDAKLTWTTKAYEWIVRRAGVGSYQITPADGQDLYWFDKFGIGQVVITKSGATIEPPESFFNIVPLL